MQTSKNPFKIYGLLCALLLIAEGCSNPSSPSMSTSSLSAEERTKENAEVVLKSQDKQVVFDSGILKQSGDKLVVVLVNSQMAKVNYIRLELEGDIEPNVEYKIGSTKGVRLGAEYAVDTGSEAPRDINPSAKDAPLDVRGLFSQGYIKFVKLPDVKDFDAATPLHKALTAANAEFELNLRDPKESAPKESVVVTGKGNASTGFSQTYRAMSASTPLPFQVVAVDTKVQQPSGKNVTQVVLFGSLHKVKSKDGDSEFTPGEVILIVLDKLPARNEVYKASDVFVNMIGEGIAKSIGSALAKLVGDPPLGGKAKNIFESPFATTRCSALVKCKLISDMFKTEKQKDSELSHMVESGNVSFPKLPDKVGDLIVADLSLMILGDEKGKIKRIPLTARVFDIWVGLTEEADAKEEK